MKRTLILLLLVMGLLCLAAPASAAPDTPPPPPPVGSETPNISELPEFTQQDYNCWVTAYGLLGSSLSLFISGWSQGGAWVTVVRTIVYTGRLVTLVSFVYSCLDIELVQEQLLGGLKIRCAAGGWIWVPGSRTWQC